MGESFPTILQAYTEVGILGLLAVIVIILGVKAFHNNRKDVNWGKNKIDKKDDLLENDKQSIESQLKELTAMVMNQNAKNLDAEREMNKELIQQIVDGIANHGLSHSENASLTVMNQNIDAILQDILIETNASRVSLVQYHNGGKGINKQAFLKMSMTNEKIQLGVKPIISDFKDQFRSVLGYFVNEIEANGHCYITDVNEMIEKDIGMYEFMRNRGVESKFGYAIHDSNNMVIAFICVEYGSKAKATVETIDTSFKEHYREIERLLNSVTNSL